LDGKCVCNSQSTDKDGVCVLNIGQAYNFLATISYDNISSASSNTIGGSIGLSTSSTSGSVLVSTPITTTTIITTTTTTIPVVVNSTVTSTPQVIISNGTCT